MAPAVATGILAAVPEVTKLATGLAQRRKANRINVGKRKVSKELRDVTKRKKTRATAAKFAGEDRLRDRLEATSANVAEKAKSAAGPNEYLQIISRQGGKMQDKDLEIGEFAARDKSRRESEADAAEEMLGAEKTRIREADIAEQKAAKSGLMDASTQNIQSAVKGAAGIASTMIPIEDNDSTRSTGEGSNLVETKDTGANTNDVIKTSGNDIAVPNRGGSDIDKMRKYLEENPELLKMFKNIRL